MQSDDSFWLVLDTAHDHQSAYFFRTNPLGNRWDALVTDEGKLENREWDGRWDVAAAIHPWGWGVEIRIPFETLRVPAEEDLIWGIDFKRFLRRKNETAVWSNYRRDYSFVEVSQAGHLHGLEIAEKRNTLIVKPYVVAGLNDVSSDGEVARETDVDAGIEDVRYSLGSHVNLNLSFNPDFAQAEVDEFQVNLTRFPLFFEEKREFFLEDAGLYELGTGGGEPDVKLLHTRRIGLTEDRQPIALLYGARVHGQFSGWTTGVMNVQTTTGRDSSRRNFGVYRVKKRLLTRSYVGLMTTHVAGGAQGDNTALGFDARFVLFENLTFDSFVTRSTSQGEDGAGWTSLPFRLRWDSDRLSFRAEQLVVGRDARLDAGFIRRLDIRNNDIELAWKPRPAAEWLRQLTLEGGVSYLTDLDGRLLTRDVSANFEMELEAGDSIELEYARNREQLDEGFQLADRILVAPGIYVSDQLGLELRPYDGRKISGFFRVAREVSVWQERTSGEAGGALSTWVPTSDGRIIF